MKDAPLLSLGRALRGHGYRFITPTPATIVRVNRRPENHSATDLAGIFGWNRPFLETLIDRALFAMLRDSRLILPTEGGWRSAVRASTLGEALYFHSPFPTEDENAVFFGPDSYRFAQLLDCELQGAPAPRRLLDLGCGTGVGGLHVAHRLAGLELTLSDINPSALAFARVNAALAGLAATLLESDLFAATSGQYDLIIANPPYMMDAGRRTYRDGGGRFGEEISLRIVGDSLARLTPGGRLVLYTGSAICRGKDGFANALAPLLGRTGLDYRYRELDPDVFGEELDQPAYREVDRIAAVALTVTRTP